MDPKATLAIVLDHDAEDHERESAALDLLVWLANGGSVPDTFVRNYVVSRCERVLIEVLDR